MTDEQLDKAEQSAINRALGAAYAATEGVAPEAQRKVYNTMKTYICTGIRLMREEIERINK